MNCHKCGGTLARKGYTHSINVGGVTVNDASGLVLTCDTCGEVVLSSKELAGYERRAARVALTDAKDIGGGALKFARKALGLRQKDLAALLKRNEQQISRDENANELPIDLRLAVVALLTMAERGESLKAVASNEETTLAVTPLRAKVA
jgi:hypothetical protein